ncbi:MAG: hypothetical protein HOI95_02775 [Chromatiales bacterium]|jgi:hypothetical protein|nr:hypothetical protein [Chromatiales bacterium]
MHHRPGQGSRYNKDVGEHPIVDVAADRDFTHIIKADESGRFAALEWQINALCVGE